jgi:hypothetical protein
MESGGELKSVKDVVVASFRTATHISLAKQCETTRNLKGCCSEKHLKHLPHVTHK